MNENVELLNYIYQNAEMGQDSINKLLDILENETNQEFKNMLESQFKEYKNIFDEAEEKLNNFNKDAKGINSWQKMETYLMISMKTMKNKTPDNISAMLMQGSVMGIIQITRRLKLYKNKVESEIYSLGEKLLATEERNLEECKKFLGMELEYAVKA